MAVAAHRYASKTQESMFSLVCHWFPGQRFCGTDHLKGPYLVKYSVQPRGITRVLVNQGKAVIGRVCSGMNRRAWLRADTLTALSRGERCSTFQLVSYFQSLTVGPTIDKWVMVSLSLGKIVHTPAH